MNKLPHRLRETQFRRYEDLIARIVTVFPSCIIVDPQKHYTIAPSTFAGRLRDAMKSLKDNDWDSVKVNRTTFLAVVDSVVVRERSDGLVAIGNRDTTLAKPAKPNDVPIDVPVSDNKLIIGDETLKHFICMLAHRRLLRTPVEVIGITAMEAQTLQDSYDVYLDKTTDGYMLR